MAMDQFLAEYFGNTKTASENQVDDTTAEKVAQMEVFSKLAADEGIDLEKLSEDQIAYLWNETFKTAGDDGEDSSKKEEAEKEHEEKKEAMAKMAEATFLGKVMAHSLVSELREISKTAEDPGEVNEEADKIASKLTELGMKLRYGAKSVGSKLRDVVTAKELREGLTAKKNVGGAAGATMAGRHAMQNAPKGARDAFQKATLYEAGEAAKKKIRSGAAKTTALYGGTAAAAGGGVALARGKKKESSALDELAVKAALEKVAEAGFDVDQGIELLTGVFAEGLGESEKVASADHVEDAIHVRSLEFLEAAGYPVTWEG